MRVRAVLVGIVACAVLAVAPGPAAAQAATPTYQELYRPQFHFTPGEHWMNDPNGLVYYQGEYHMFYQWNPLGDTSGATSPGVTPSAATWSTGRSCGLAISFDDRETIFSGSVVVDKDNTSGFGTKDNPPMVAIYSSAALPNFAQSQALAYSLDRGRTWTKYAGNPVLDNPDPDFRDPKVFWYEPTKRWIMPVALSLQRKIQFYSSPNLKNWTLEGDFGPAGCHRRGLRGPEPDPAAGAGRRQPDQVAADRQHQPGRPGGGSAAQYFIGDFDGHRFQADPEQPYTPPSGDVLADFEGADYGDWTVTGTAFGTGPLTRRHTRPAPDRPIRGLRAGQQPPAR